MNMSPQEVLERAKAMLVSEQFAPVIGQTLANATSIPKAAAMLIYPIVFKMQQDTGLPDDEILGNDDGDGIAIHLLAEVFEIAAEAGYLPGGEGAEEPGGGPQEQVEGEEPPAEASEEQRAMAEEAVGILADLLAKSGDAMTQVSAGGDQESPAENAGEPAEEPGEAPMQPGLMGGPPQ